jgi:hypothetical protein
MDARGGKDTSVLQAGKAASRLSATTPATCREGCHAAFSPDAFNRPQVPRMRLPDEKASWRIVYRIDVDAIVIVEVFSKKTGTMSKRVIETFKARLREYDRG